jgi:hypothetical protein
MPTLRTTVCNLTKLKTIRHAKISNNHNVMSSKKKKGAGSKANKISKNRLKHQLTCNPKKISNSQQ